jgi:hypothetical protein
MERYQRYKSKEHTIYEITEAIRLYKKINEDALIRYVKISRVWYNKLKKEIAKANPNVFRFDRHTKEWHYVPLDSRNEDLPINPLVARNSLDLLIQIIKKHGRIKEEKLIQESGVTKGTYYHLKRKIVTSHPSHQYIFHFDKQTKNWSYLPLLAPTDENPLGEELQKRIKEQPPNPYAIKDTVILLKKIIKHYGQIKEEHLYLKAGISRGRYYELRKKLAEFEPNTIKFDRFTKTWHYLPTNPIPKEHDLPANIATARNSLDLLVYYIRQHGTIDEPSLIKLGGIGTGRYFQLKKDLLEIDPQSIKFNRHTKTWHCSSPNPIPKEGSVTLSVRGNVFPFG